MSGANRKESKMASANGMKTSRAKYKTATTITTDNKVALRAAGLDELSLSETGWFLSLARRALPFAFRAPLS